MKYLLSLLIVLGVIDATSAQTATLSPVPLCTPAPIACESDTLPRLQEFKAGESYLTVVCRPDRDAVESLRTANGAPLWSFNREFATVSEPGDAAGKLRRYRFTIDGNVAHRITANENQRKQLDGFVRSVDDARAACLDSAEIASVTRTPSIDGSQGERCDIGTWPLFSISDPAQLQQRLFAWPDEMASALANSDGTRWYFEGIAACTASPSMSMELTASVSGTGNTFSLAMSVTHKGAASDIARSPKILAAIPRGYGVRIGTSPCNIVDQGARGMDLVCAPHALRPNESASFGVELVKVRSDAAPLAVRAIAVGPAAGSFPSEDVRLRTPTICTGNKTPVIGCAVAAVNGAQLDLPEYPRLPDEPPPVANQDVLSVNAGTTVNYSPLVNDSAAKPQIGLRLLSVGNPSIGSLRFTGNTVSYTAPMVVVNTQVAVPYRIIDQYGRIGSSQMLITVIAPNRAPLAVNDTFTIEAGEIAVLNPLQNDSDPDGDAIRISAISFSSPNARVTFNATTVQVVPIDDFVGVVTIPYTVTDGKLTTSAIMTFNVVVPTPPASELDYVESRVSLVTTSPVGSDVRFVTLRGEIGIKTNAPTSIATTLRPMEVKVWFRLRDSDAWRTAEHAWWEARRPQQSYRLVRGSGLIPFTGGIALKPGQRADALRLCVTSAAVTAPDNECRRPTAQSRLGRVVTLPF